MTFSDSDPDCPPDRLLDVDDALRVLGVEREQLDALIAGDMLVPRGRRDGSPLFAESELMAVRMVGG